MSASPEIVQTCSQCGASIYPEHFQRGLAVRQSGQIYCRHCMDERSHATPTSVPTVDLAPLPMSDAPSPADRAVALPQQTPAGPVLAEAPHTRPISKSSGATRVRTFHAKLSDAAIQHLDHQVNSWLDVHPDVEVKFATTAVGTWEGKHPEPNLVLTIFY